MGDPFSKMPSYRPADDLTTGEFDATEDDKVLEKTSPEKKGAQSGRVTTNVGTANLGTQGMSRKITVPVSKKVLGEAAGQPKPSRPPPPAPGRSPHTVSSPPASPKLKHTSGKMLQAGGRALPKPPTDEKKEHDSITPAERRQLVLNIKHHQKRCGMTRFNSPQTTDQRANALNQYRGYVSRLPDSTFKTSAQERLREFEGELGSEVVDLANEKMPIYAEDVGVEDTSGGAHGPPPAIPPRKDRGELPSTKSEPEVVGSDDSDDDSDELIATPPKHGRGFDVSPQLAGKRGAFAMTRDQWKGIDLKAFSEEQQTLEFPAEFNEKLAALTEHLAQSKEALASLNDSKELPGIELEIRKMIGEVDDADLKQQMQEAFDEALSGAAVEGVAVEKEARAPELPAEFVQDLKEFATEYAAKANSVDQIDRAMLNAQKIALFMEAEKVQDADPELAQAMANAITKAMTDALGIGDVAEVAAVDEHVEVAVVHTDPPQIDGLSEVAQQSLNRLVELTDRMEGGGLNQVVDGKPILEAMGDAFFSVAGFAQGIEMKKDRATGEEKLLATTIRAALGEQVERAKTLSERTDIEPQHAVNSDEFPAMGRNRLRQPIFEDETDASTALRMLENSSKGTSVDVAMGALLQYAGGSPAAKNDLDEAIRRLESEVSALSRSGAKEDKHRIRALKDLVKTLQRGRKNPATAAEVMGSLAVAGHKGTSAGQVKTKMLQLADKLQQLQRAQKKIADPKCGHLDVANARQLEGEVKALRAEVGVALGRIEGEIAVCERSGAVARTLELKGFKKEIETMLSSERLVPESKLWLDANKEYTSQDLQLGVNSFFTGTFGTDDCPFLLDPDDQAHKDNVAALTTGFDLCPKYDPENAEIIDFVQDFTNRLIGTLETKQKYRGLTRTDEGFSKRVRYKNDELKEQAVDKLCRNRKAELNEAGTELVSREDAIAQLGGADAIRGAVKESDVERYVGSNIDKYIEEFDGDTPPTREEASATLREQAYEHFAEKQIQEHIGDRTDEIIRAEVEGNYDSLLDAAGGIHDFLNIGNESQSIEDGIAAMGGKEEALRIIDEDIAKLQALEAEFSAREPKVDMSTAYGPATNIAAVAAEDNAIKGRKKLQALRAQVEKAQV